MAVKKKTVLGPKAKLMKKNVDQLKRQAKKLKIQGYSTKKKEQLVNSIMMAEARAKRKPGTKRKKPAAKKPAAKRMTRAAIGTNFGGMRGSSMKRMVKKRGAMPNKVMRKPMMADQTYNGWSSYETWLANLWFDDTLYGLILEEYGEDVKFDQQLDVADSLKYYIEDMVQESMGQSGSSAGFVNDLINAALSSINYYEIAGHVIEQINP